MSAPSGPGLAQDATSMSAVVERTTDPRPRSLTPAARVLRAGVRGYRRLATGRLSPCRFDPSCSTYALEALERHGAGRGMWLSVRRLSHCHPWGGVGWDPVPERKAN